MIQLCISQKLCNAQSWWAWKLDLNKNNRCSYNKPNTHRACVAILMLGIRSVHVHTIFQKTTKTVIYVFWSLHEFTGCNHWAARGGIYSHGEAGKVPLKVERQRACKHRQRPSFIQHLTTALRHRWLTDWLTRWAIGQVDDWVNDLNGVINKRQWQLSALFILFQKYFSDCCLLLWKGDSKAPNQ